MTARIRLLVAMSRPAVMLLLALYTALGCAAAGGAGAGLVLRALPAVAGLLLFSVAVNDVADEAVDRVNLAPQPGRPLLTGAMHRRDMVMVAALAAAVALADAAWLGAWAAAVTLAGLAVSAAYSLPPMRLSARGAVASLMLPACYVAVPFVLGAFTTGRSLSAAAWVLLAGSYVGFIGRILLKDFRDLRGDALFGKRTFLVRYGRRPTCVTSAACWVVGAALLVGATAGSGRPWAAMAASYAVGLPGVLGLLRLLADDRGPRRDERIIAAIAIVGRGMLLVLLATLTGDRVAPAVLAGLVALLTLATAGQATVMFRQGPVRRCTVPVEWVDAEAAQARREERNVTSPTRNVSAAKPAAVR